MDFSLFYFADDSTAAGSGRYRLLLDGARFADESGFRAVWTPERHFHPFGGLYPNPAVTGAALAAATTHVQIRAGSVVAPLHDPLRIAEEWSVVDNLSGGRAGVSFASGWHAVDFALAPEAYRDRKRLTLQTLDEVRQLWRGEPRTVRDGAGGTAQVRIFPPPVQSQLPVWLTSAGDTETFRAAGRVGAGVLTHLIGQTVDDLAGKVTEYRRTLAEHHPGAPGHVAVMLHTCLGDDTEEVRATVREPLLGYLASSAGLVLRSESALAPDLDLSALDPDDLQFLVAKSFDRYFDDRGLFGTVGRARGTVERLRAAGADEIACLIDFGVGVDEVLAGLRHLARLRDEAAGRTEHPGNALGTGVRP